MKGPKEKSEGITRLKTTLSSLKDVLCNCVRIWLYLSSTLIFGYMASSCKVFVELLSYRLGVKVESHIGQHWVFANIWDVRNYGYMLNAGQDWGLLHVSNIVLYSGESLFRYGNIGDVLLVKAISSADGAGCSFSNRGIKKLNSQEAYVKVFQNQFGTLECDSKIIKVNDDGGVEVSVDDVGSIDLRNSLLGYVPKDEAAWDGEAWDKSNRRVGQKVRVKIVGYDAHRKRLIFSRKALIPKPWSSIINSGERIYVNGVVLEICLNAVTAAVPPYGKLMIPFDCVDNYEDVINRGDGVVGSEISVAVQSVDSKLLVTAEITEERADATAINDLRQLPGDNCSTYGVGAKSKQRTTVLLIGATGSGKSSLVNALLDERSCSEKSRAEVSVVDPMTNVIEKYEAASLDLWDTPGMGDGVVNDAKHSGDIKNWLDSRNSQDVVLMAVFDANTRDYGSTFRVLNNIGKRDFKKIVLCVNRIDAMFPMGIFASEYQEFDRECSYDCSAKSKFGVKILEKSDSIKKRVEESVGIDGEVVVTATKIVGAGSGESYNIERLYNLLDLG